MKDRDNGHPPSKAFRTRKSDIISGLAVCVTIPVASTVWNLRGDIQELVESKNVVSQVRIDKLRADFRQELERERETSREREREIKADIRELRSQILRMRGVK